MSKSSRLNQELTSLRAELRARNEQLDLARKELEANRKSAADLYAFSPVAYLTINAQGVIERSNLATSYLLGLAQTQLQGHSLWSFIAERDHAVCQDLLQKLSAGQNPDSVEVTLRGPVSPARVVRIEGITDGNDQTRRLVLVDMTMRLAAQEHSRDATRLIQGALDALTAHICVLNREGEILFTNRPWVQFARANFLPGREPKTGGNYLTVCANATGVHAADAAKFSRGLRAVIAGTLPNFEMEYDCHSPTEKRWFLARVSRFPGDGEARVAVAHENITKRVQAGANRQRLLNALDFNFNEIYLIEEPSLRIHYLNEAARHNLERSTAADFLHIKDGLDGVLDPSRIERPLESLRSRARNKVEIETMHYRKDGSRYPVEMHIQLVGNADDRMILMLATDITDRLQQSEMLARVTKQLITAEDTERRRIAKELHDSTAQNLVAAMMHLEFIRNYDVDRPSIEAKQIEDTLKLLEHCAKEIRSFAYLLHPPRLDDAGIGEAIRHYVVGYGERTGLKMTIELPRILGRFDETVELVLFRILQEALGNIHRHADSKTARVCISLEPEMIILEISDEGHGFEVENENSHSNTMSKHGVGIPSMRERLRLIDGKLHIESSKHGTLIRASAPREPQIL